jgi:hypothetical protein
MNKTLKWILGALLVVIVLGALVAAGFMWRSHWTWGGYAGLPAQPGWQAGPMMGGDWSRWHSGPMMHGYGPDRNFGPGASPFNWFFFLGGFLRLVVFGLLLYGAYWLGRRNARVVVDNGKPVVNNPGDPPAAE